MCLCCGSVIGAQTGGDGVDRRMGLASGTCTVWRRTATSMRSVPLPGPKEKHTCQIRNLKNRRHAGAGFWWRGN